MSHRAFEYHTEFAPLHYLVRTKKLFMFKSEEPSTDPDVQGFLQDPEHQQRLAQLGQEGWELISVQPVVRGEVQIGIKTPKAGPTVLPCPPDIFFSSNARSTVTEGAVTARRNPNSPGYGFLAATIA